MRTNRTWAWARLPVGLALALVVLAQMAPAQAPPSLPPEKIVEVLGQRIHYFEAGQGPNVIFLHGLGGDAGMWEANIGPVSGKYRVYALDQIGFGRSDKPLIDYKIETFVEFLQSFMRALGTPKATLVGNSLGGWIAADFATQHPEMVEKLVLVDAAGMRVERNPELLPVDLHPSSLASTRTNLQSVVYNNTSETDALVRRVFEQ